MKNILNFVFFLCMVPFLQAQTINYPPQFNLDMIPNGDGTYTAAPGGTGTQTIYNMPTPILLMCSGPGAGQYSACPSGGGGSGTVNPGTTGQIAYYAANGTAVSGSPALTDAAGDITQPNLATLNKEIVITSSTDLTGDLSAAVLASPSCTDSQGITLAHCPHIRVAPGPYPASTPITIDTAYMDIHIDGAQITDTHNTTACLITLTDASDPSPTGPIRALDSGSYFGGKDFAINGSGAASNSCGIMVKDIFGLTVEAGVNYYPGTTSSGFWQEDNIGATERGHFIITTQPPTGVGVRVSTTGVNPVPTTGYGTEYQIYCSSGAGTCFEGDGTVFDSVGTFHMIANLNNNATCMKGRSGFIFSVAQYHIHCENDQLTGGNAIGRDFDSSTQWRGGMGTYSHLGNMLETSFVPNGGNTAFEDNTNGANENFISGSPLTIQNQGAVNCTNSFCNFLMDRNSSSNTAVFGIFPPGTVNTANPVWEIGEWQGENDLTINCYNGSRVVCARVTTGGDLQATSAHLTGAVNAGPNIALIKNTNSTGWSSIGAENDTAGHDTGVGKAGTAASALSSLGIAVDESYVLATSSNLDLISSVASTVVRFIPGGSTETARAKSTGLCILNTTCTNALGVTGGITASTSMQAATYTTATNCSDKNNPAVCGSAAAGSVVIAAAATSVTVNTTAVTANSQILLTPDESLGTKLGVTCNTTAASALAGLGITARVPGTSFTVTTLGTIATNPACLSYQIIN